MRRKTFFFCLVVISWFNLGVCLNCYMCAGSLTSDCAKGKTSSMAVNDCLGPRLHSTFGGLNETVYRSVCITATSLDFETKMILRTCNERTFDTDPCEIWIKHRHCETCKSCTTDMCNSHEEDENSVHLIP